MTLTELIVLGLILAITMILPRKASYVSHSDQSIDVDISELNEEAYVDLDEDRFKTMWNQQEAFMRLLQQKRGFPEFPTDISSKQGQKFLKDITHHMMDELFEAAQHLKNSKSHRVTLVPEVDREAYKEELCDALHLYIELVIASGITLDELYNAYMAKGDTNTQRIVNGY